MNDSFERITDPELKNLEERLRSLNARKTPYQTQLRIELAEQSFLRRRVFQKKVDSWNRVAMFVGKILFILLVMSTFYLRYTIYHRPVEKPGHVVETVTQPVTKIEIPTVRQQMSALLNEIQSEKSIDLKKPVYPVVEIQICDKKYEPQLEKTHPPIPSLRTIMRGGFESRFL